MTKAAQITREFGEPFREVVRGFAEMGFSRTATAEALEVNRGHFRHLCERYQVGDVFKPQGEQRKESRPGGKGWPKGKARPRAPRYTDEQMLDQVRRFPNASTFATMADISISTVQRRFGTFTKAREAAARRKNA